MGNRIRRLASRIVRAYGDFRENPEKPGAAVGAEGPTPRPEADVEWRIDDLGQCKACGDNPGRLRMLRDGTYFCNPCWVGHGDPDGEVAEANAYHEKQRAGQGYTRPAGSHVCETCGERGLKDCGGTPCRRGPGEPPDSERLPV